MHPDVQCSVTNNRQETEATQVLVGGQVDEKAVVHLHNGIPLGHMKE